MSVRTTSGEGMSCTEDQWQEMRARTLAAAPKVLPANWREVHVREDSVIFGSLAYSCRDGKVVVFSTGPHEGKWWLHVSVSRAQQIPFYADLCDVKELFIGRDRQAIQVFPPRSRHINIHKFCLHLWSCLEAEGDGLPDFGRSGTI